MKVRQFLLLALLPLLLPSAARAQYNPFWQWAKADATAAIAAPGGMSSILAVKNARALWGRMTTIRRFDPSNNAQGNYSFNEYDSTGRVLGSSVMFGKVQLFDAQADASGNWYILGRYYDSLTLGNGATYIRPNPSANTDADHFMVKLSAGTLSVLWMRPIGPLTTVSARAFTVDASRIYLAADSDVYTSVRAMSFSNGDATTLFTQANGSSGSTTTSIQTDAFGGIYLAGGCNVGGVNFNGPAESPTIPDPYGYIVKYNSTGTHQWHYWFKDLDCSQRKLTLYKNTVLYYTGNMHDTMTLGTNVTVHPGRGGYYAARLNPGTGAVLWTRTLDTMGGGGAVPGNAYHAAVTPDTALVMFLEGSGYINWGDTFSTDLQTVSSSAVLASVSATDSMRWVRTAFAQFTTNAHVVAEGDAVWVCGVAYAAGGQVVFDTLHLTVPALTYTPYMARLRLTRPKVIIGPGAVGNTNMPPNAAVAPVPAKYALRISGMSGGGIAILHDITGREAARIDIAKGSNDVIMDVATQPRGTYALELRDADGGITVRKVVLE